MVRSRGDFAVVVLCVAFANVATAQDFRPHDWPTLNLFGQPGLIDMPGGRPLPDGEFAVSVSNFAGTTRYQFLTQLHPRLSGGFRYTQIKNFDSAGFDTYFDRSFDLRFTLVEEGQVAPSVTVGLQDFIGTGIYGAEYLVASKQITPDLEFTGGLGWGRLSGGGNLPGFGEREELTPDVVAEGGTPNFDSLFRGDVGLFGGVQWRASDSVILKAEYSSDDYRLEDDELGIFERNSPLNFGLEYQPNESFLFGAYYLYGSEVGLRFNINFNPKRPPTFGSVDTAPAPIAPRPSRSSYPQAYTTEWAASVSQKSTVRERLADALIDENLEMEALTLTASSAVLYLRNTGYQAPAQALGRAARLMARLLPSSIDTFSIVPVRAGMELPAFNFSRGDLEKYEVAPDGSERILDAAVVTENPVRPMPESFADGVYPRFIWQLGPYVETSLFDPDNPFRADLGVEVGAGFELSPGFVVTGSLRKRIAGNLDQSTRESNSVLPHVRSDFPLYDKNGDPGMETLSAAYYFQPGQNLYGRVTTGYLEEMFAGVSGEVLWSPYESDFSLGLELNYVRQRDYDGAFGLLDYDVVTGHASLYYRFNDDYFAQVDAGRYLAGDDGATVALERVFANGWRVGAFATMTNVSADEFGEGSFDKGITVSVPLGWFTGRSNVNVQPMTIRPLQRDGGARLSVPGRLYDLVEDGGKQRVEEQWGRFWR